MLIPGTVLLKQNMLSIKIYLLNMYNIKIDNILIINYFK